VLATKNGLGVKPGFLGYVDEGYAEIAVRLRGGWSFLTECGSGRASERTSENDSTRAERQRDVRNFRRDCDKREYPPCCSPS